MLDLGLDEEIQKAAALAVVGKSVATHRYSHACGKHGRDRGAVRQRRCAQLADLGTYLGLSGVYVNQNTMDNQENSRTYIEFVLRKLLPWTNLGYGRIITL